jgi:hypothetical protein
MGRDRSKRTKIQRIRDRVLIADWYCHGMTQSQIAVNLRDKYYPTEQPLTHQQISNELKVIIKDWKSEYTFSIDEHKAIEIEKINRLEQVYYDAWVKSTGERESTFTERNEGATARLKARISKEQRDGNPTFLAGIQWCINARCSLLGLNAPVAQENKGTTTIRLVYEEKKKGVDNDIEQVLQ